MVIPTTLVELAAIVDLLVLVVCGIGGGRDNRHHHHQQWTANDIVYDIPLKNCNADTKRKLEELLKLKGFEGFIKDVEHYISIRNVMKNYVP